MWGNDDRGNSIEVVGEAEFILTQEEIDEAIEEAIEEGEDEAEIEVEEVEGWVKMEYWSSDVEADDSHTLELNSPEVELTVIIDVESEEITQFETRSFFDMLSACCLM